MLPLGHPPVNKSPEEAAFLKLTEVDDSYHSSTVAADKSPPQVARELTKIFGLPESCRKHLL